MGKDISIHSDITFGDKSTHSVNSANSDHGAPSTNTPPGFYAPYGSMNSGILKGSSLHDLLLGDPSPPVPVYPPVASLEMPPKSIPAYGMGSDYYPRSSSGRNATAPYVPTPFSAHGPSYHHGRPSPNPVGGSPLDFGSMSPDDLSLFHEFKSAFDSRNVRNAVSVLRRIYPKQSRYLRIPDLLNETVPSFAPLVPGSVGHIYGLFLLHCVQWSFGLRNKRKGESVDSFKYNMNKNISCWLLNVLHQRLENMEVFPEMRKSAIDIVCHMLDNVCELEFANEVLTRVGAENIPDILGPFVELWQHSDVPALIVRANTFAMKEGYPVTANPMELSMLQGMAGYGGPSGTSKRHMMGMIAGLNIIDDTQEVPIKMPQGPPGMSSLNPRASTFQTGGSLAAAMRTATASADMIVDMNVLTQILSRIGGAQHATVEDRLLAMVAASKHGILSTRIPSLYLELFDEPVDTKTVSIKDTLIGTCGAAVLGELCA